MRLKEADEILKKLAGGRYRAIKFELGHYSSGEVRTVCGVYIDGGKWYEAPTFERALESLRALGKSELEEEQEVDDADLETMVPNPSGTVTRTGSGDEGILQPSDPGGDPGGEKGEGG